METIKRVIGGRIEFPVDIEEGEEVLIHVEKVPKRHSALARRFYFGAVVRYIAEEMQQRKENVHHMLTASRFPVEVPNPLTGEITKIGKSLSIMTVDELVELTNMAIEVAHFLNIKLPTVDQYWEGLTK